MVYTEDKKTGFDVDVCNKKQLHFDNSASSQVEFKNLYIFLHPKLMSLKISLYTKSLHDNYIWLIT